MRTRPDSETIVYSVTSRIDGATIGDVVYERLGEGRWLWSIATLKAIKSGEVNLAKPTYEHARRVVRKSI